MHAKIRFTYRSAADPLGVLCLLAGLVVGCVGGAATRAPAAGPSETPQPEQRELNLRSFDTIWETVRDKHFDPTLGGLDWPAVREELRPRVEQAATTQEARQVMQEMLSRLGQSHFAIIPAQVYGDLTGHEEVPGTDLGRDDGTIGLTVRVVEGAPWVTQVHAGLPAAAAGVRAGWQVLEVDGEPVAPAIERVAEEYRDSTLGDCFTAQVVEGMLSPPAGGSVEVKFRDGTDRELVLSIPARKLPGTPARFGHLPTMYLDIESRRLPSDVGYIRFNVFIDPPKLLKAVEDAVLSFMDAPGVVIDLRGNPGGLGPLALGIGSWFVAESDQYLGKMILRETELKFVLNPRGRTYPGSLAILVDGCSMSTSEIFTGGLQDIGRARVFGSRTGGAALPSIIERLPNGDGFQYAHANFISYGGEELEGRGVQPDVTVTPDRAALLAGRDPTLDAAVSWILSESSPSAAPSAGRKPNQGVSR